MRRLAASFCIAMLGSGLGLSSSRADDVPVPRPRPAVPKVWTEPLSFREAAGADFKTEKVTSEASACRQRLEKMAALSVLPRLIGPGACGGADIVELTAVLIAGGQRIEIKPSPVMRCEMAEQLTLWVREDAAPRIGKDGPALASVETYDNFSCRGRNRVRGARLSEHGKANAVDLRSITLADKRVIMLTDKTVDKDLRSDLRAAACARFTTVLGPGSDGYHDEHIHLDLSERRGGYRICQWNVLEPPPPPPPPKPKEEPEVAKVEPPKDGDEGETSVDAGKAAAAKPDEQKLDDKKPDEKKVEPVTPGPAKTAAVKPEPVPAPAAPAKPARATPAPARLAPLQLTQLAVPLPKPRPKPRPVRRKSRDAIYFPFNLLR